MASRSYIGIENEKGLIRAVYCHWDGYLEHNGIILFKDYNNRGRISLLINQGSLSSLLSLIDKCDFYIHRDEKNIDITELQNRDEFISSAFDVSATAYLFTKEDKWIYWDNIKQPPNDLEQAILRLHK